MNKKSVSNRLEKLDERIDDIVRNPTHFKCAYGVRKTLNALFGKHRTYGDIDPGGTLSINAKDYDEEILSQWQTTDMSYQKVWKFKKPINYQIRVLRPKGDCQSSMANAYGHIEFYYDGHWYSDHQQPSSYKSDCFYQPEIYDLIKKR
jgi:hypothetical protein